MTQIDFSGRSLGGFRVLRKLGQGGMAVVYKAHEESLNRVVALKVIAQHLAEQPQFVERFRREAQAAAQLSHPNIVQIYAIGEDQGVHYFSMEYVKGRSLADLVEKEGFLTSGRALPIIAQAAEALAVAHDAGIVHRDIKPANIMIDEAGRVRVADFGIAQMATATRMTQSGMLVGTPEYISPEQCRGEKLDGRSDIYALGVTLYQMLSGRTPFDADTPAGLVLQIVEGRRPELGALNPTVPASVQRLVEKMMDTDRSQRFQSAEDLIHAIRQVDTQPATRIPTPARAPAATLPSSESTGAMAPPGQTEAMPQSGPTEAMPPSGPTEAIRTAATTVALPPEPAAAAPNRAARPQPAATSASTTAHPAAKAHFASGGRRNSALVFAALLIAVLGLAFAAWLLLPGASAPTDSLAVADLTGGQDAGPPEDSGDALGSGGTGGAEGISGDARTAGAGNDEGAGGGEDTDPAAASNAPAGALAGGATTTSATSAAGGGTPPAAGVSSSGDPATGGDSTAGNPQGSGVTTAGGNPATAVEVPAAGATTGVSGGAPSQPAAGDPAQPAAGDPAEITAAGEPAFQPPPLNSIVAETSGEYEYVDLVNTWVEAALVGQSFEVIDYPSSPYGSLQEAARFHVVTTARLIDSRQLEYFGRTQTQYTVALTMRATDLTNGVTVVGPLNTTVQYTSINLRQNLEKGATDLARQLTRDLRRQIQ
jgi:serine/threonine-protein kinase